MLGGLIAGGLGAAFAAVAQVLIWTGMDRALGPAAKSLRVLAAAFVAGEMMLGFVLVLLNIFLDGAVDPILGLVTAGLMGVGCFGIALTFRRYASLPTEPTARDRSGALVRMAISQAIGTIGVLITMLSLFLAPA